MKNNGSEIEHWFTPHINFDNHVMPVLFSCLHSMYCLRFDRQV